MKDNIQPAGDVVNNAIEPPAIDFPEPNGDISPQNPMRGKGRPGAEIRFEKVPNNGVWEVAPVNEQGLWEAYFLFGQTQTMRLFQWVRGEGASPYTDPITFYTKVRAPTIEVPTSGQEMSLWDYKIDTKFPYSSATVEIEISEEGGALANRGVAVWKGDYWGYPNPQLTIGYYSIRTRQTMPAFGKTSDWSNSVSFRVGMPPKP